MVRLGGGIALLSTLLLGCAGGESVTGGGGSAKDAGSGSSSDGSGGSGGTVPTSGPGGLVLVQESIPSSGGGAPDTYQLTASAGFSKDLTTLLATSCSTATTMGDCQVEACDGTGAMNVTGDVSAGTISVSGTAVPATLTTNFDDSYATYTAMSTEGPVFLPNSTIKVAAAGATVPAFSASFQLGGTVALSAPTLSTNNPLNFPTATFPSTGAVTVSWTGSDELQLFLSANSAADSSKTENVTCVFSGGSGSVPASAMATMTGIGTLGAGAYAEQVVPVGGYNVIVKVQAITIVGAFTKSS